MRTPYRGRGTPPKKGDVEDALSKLDGVKKYSELPTDEHAHSFELVSEQDVDLRPELFKLVVDKGWVLLELHRDAQTLEDVFRSLTIGDERRNRTLTTATSGDDDDQDDDEDDEEDDDERNDARRPGVGDEKVAKGERS